MQLAASVIVLLLNVLFCFAGLRVALPPFWEAPGIGTAWALLVNAAPFACTAAFAAGKRSRAIWLTAAVANAFIVVTMLVLVAMARGGQAGQGSALLSGIAIAGAFACVNVAFLLWRMPASERLSAAAQEAGK